jgi:hypothetical protein
MLFKVVQVINQNTVKIFPKWNWNDLSGNIVGIRSLVGVELDDCDDCDKLEELILNKAVEFKYPEYVHRKKLLCDLHLLE